MLEGMRLARTASGDAGRSVADGTIEILGTSVIGFLDKPSNSLGMTEAVFIVAPGRLSRPERLHSGQSSSLGVTSTISSSSGYRRRLVSIWLNSWSHALDWLQYYQC